MEVKMSRADEVRQRLAQLHGEAAGSRVAEEPMVDIGGLQVKLGVLEEARRCKTPQECRARWPGLGEQLWGFMVKEGWKLPRGVDPAKPAGVSPEGMSQDVKLVLKLGSRVEAVEELGKRGAELWDQLHPVAQRIVQASGGEVAEAPKPAGEREKRAEVVGMFHHRKCLFFGRYPNGGVRILKLPEDPKYSTLVGWPAVGGDYPEAQFDLTLDPGSWSAVVAFVSYRPEPMDGRVAGARAFHMGQEEDNRPGVVDGMPIEAGEA
jgi:hypothetical protein